VIIEAALARKREFALNLDAAGFTIVCFISTISTG
jgi:hypothetical protein